MSVTKKTIILFSLYLLTALVMVLSFRAAESEPIKEAFMLSRVSYVIDEWQGEDVPIKNANDFFILTDTSLFNYILRKYTRDDKGPEFLLSALEDLKGTQRDIHDPRLCYESRGWTVLSYDTSIIESGGYDFGTMKVISYTDEKYNIKRFEIFGYISNGKIITNETSLRLAHIRNRVLNMFGGSRNNIIYLNVSADIRYEEMETVLKDLEFIMAEIVAVLQQGA